MEAERRSVAWEVEDAEEKTESVTCVQEALTEVRADDEANAADVVPSDVHEPFGWLPCLDPATNTEFYMHSLTGEVRWSLLADRFHPATAVVTPMKSMDMRSAFAPSFVMLPGGITPAGQVTMFDSWRGGYELFPLSQSSQGTLQETYVPEDQAEEMLKHKHRVLPCTWELSEAGPPFLDQFPVAVLQPVWLSSPQPSQIFAEANAYDSAWAPTSFVVYPPPAVTEPTSSVVEPLVQNSVVEHSSRLAHSDGYRHPCSQRKRVNHDNESSHLHKEHNRRGYSFRQARNLMKRLGLQPTRATKDVQSSNPKPLIKREGDKRTPPRAVYQPSQRTAIRVN